MKTHHLPMGVIRQYFCIALLVQPAIWGFCPHSRYIANQFRHKKSVIIGHRTWPSPANKNIADLSQHGGSTITIQHFFKSPLIEASDDWGNWAILTGMATVAQTLGQTTRLGRLLGAPVTAMALTFGLASIGVINPSGTAAARSLQLLSLQLATPLILLGADLRDCFSRCGPLLLSFFCASLATIIAGVVGWSVVGNFLKASLGRDGLIIAAALMAKNIGGGINYLAVCRTLSASPAAVAAGLCVDNIFALIYFPLTSAISSGRKDVGSHPSQGSDDNTEGSSVSATICDETTRETERISIQQVSTVLFLSTFLLWAGERIAQFAGDSSAALPVCTFLTVQWASQVPSSWMKPFQHSANVLGTTCLYLFFATAGAPGIAVAKSVRASLLPLASFLSILYIIHGALLKTCHMLWGAKMSAFQPQRLLVASSAAIGGPATAVALAQTHGWTSLEAPSLLVGNIGYAIATFCAIAYYWLFLKL